MNTQKIYVEQEENCFELAYKLALTFPERKLTFQAGVFLAFDYKHNYWDSFYSTHYWCITPDNKIQDISRLYWAKYAEHLGFDLRLPDDIKIAVITDPERALKVCANIRKEDPRFDHDQLFGGAHVVYFPGVFFAPEDVPTWIIKTMKEKQHFTIEDVCKNTI